MTGPSAGGAGGRASAGGAGGRASAGGAGGRASAGGAGGRASAGGAGGRASAGGCRWQGVGRGCRWQRVGRRWYVRRGCRWHVGRRSRRQIRRRCRYVVGGQLDRCRRGRGRRVGRRWCQRCRRRRRCQRCRVAIDARRVERRVQRGRCGNLPRGRARKPVAADRPGATALGRQDALGDRDLLFLGSELGRRSVLAAAVRSPGAGGELQPALVTVAGVDGPVAAGFAAGYLVPFAIGGRGGLGGEGEAAATQHCPGNRELGDVDVGRSGLTVTSTHRPGRIPLSLRACEVSCRVRVGEATRPPPSSAWESTPASPQGAACGPSPITADRWVPRLHPLIWFPRLLDGARRVR